MRYSMSSPIIFLFYPAIYYIYNWKSRATELYKAAIVPSIRFLCYVVHFIFIGPHELHYMYEKWTKIKYNLIQKITPTFFTFQKHWNKSNQAVFRFFSTIFILSFSNFIAHRLQVYFNFMRRFFFHIQIQSHILVFHLRTLIDMIPHLMPQPSIAFTN